MQAAQSVVSHVMPSGQSSRPDLYCSHTQPPSCIVFVAVSFPLRRSPPIDAGKTAAMAGERLRETAHFVLEMAPSMTALQDLLKLKPDFTCALALRRLFYLTEPSHIARYIEGLTRSGVPETRL